MQKVYVSPDRQLHYVQYLVIMTRQQVCVVEVSASICHIQINA